MKYRIEIAYYTEELNEEEVFKLRTELEDLSKKIKGCKGWASSSVMSMEEWKKR